MPTFEDFYTVVLQRTGNRDDLVDAVKSACNDSLAAISSYHPDILRRMTVGNVPATVAPPAVQFSKLPVPSDSDTILAVAYYDVDEFCYKQLDRESHRDIFSMDMNADTDNKPAGYIVFGDEIWITNFLSQPYSLLVYYQITPPALVGDADEVWIQNSLYPAVKMFATAIVYADLGQIEKARDLQGLAMSMANKAAGPRARGNAVEKLQLTVRTD